MSDLLLLDQAVQLMMNGLTTKPELFMLAREILFVIRKAAQVLSSVLSQVLYSIFDLSPDDVRF